MLEHKHIDCARDIQRLGTKLRNTYQNWLINNRDMNPSEAEKKANQWVNMILDEQGKESALKKYGEKKGFVQGPGILRKAAAQLSALTARNSQTRRRNNTVRVSAPSAARNTTARAPAASAARNSAPSVNEGNSVPLLPKSNISKGATRTSVLTRLKDIFKKNTGKNLLNVKTFTRDIVEKMLVAKDMTELNYLYNEIRGDLEKLAPKSKNKKTVNAAISKLEGAFIKRRRELEGAYTNRPGNPFANENNARKRQEELLGKKAPVTPATSLGSKNTNIAAAFPTAGPKANTAAPENVDLLTMPNKVPAAPAAATGANPFANNAALAQRAAQPVNKSLKAVNPLAGGARRHTKRGNRK
jgi:acetyl/propionyl-CoA carboxylase alpha subunit